MKKSKIQLWKDLENLFRPQSQYKYPGRNLPKNDLEEGMALQKFLPPFYNDAIFLDYGCGEGTMFKYIQSFYNRLPSLTICIDPDYHRLVEAKRVLLKERGCGVFFNTTFDDQNFLKKELANSIYSIICIQVFGHISECRLINALKTFYFLLESGGTLIVAIPFVNNEFRFPKWRNGVDFFCLVNCLSNLQDLSRKIIVTEKKFSYFADHSTPNLLPTRRFYINEKTEVDHKCELYKIINSRLGKLFRKTGFIIKNAIVYRVKHERGSGDLMIAFSPNKQFSTKKPFK